MSDAKIPARAATILIVAARAILGVLWLNEGVTKYRAGFGGADILLVVGSTGSNVRVSDFYKTFTDVVLGHLSGLFGVFIPFAETALGVALLLGLLTIPAALSSVFMLCLYWSADQLIGQYPVMALLSAVVLAWPVIATRASFTAAIRRRAKPGSAFQSLLDGPIRAWL